MKVNASNKNKALIELIENPNATIFLDANFFIPPDRSKYIRNVRPLPFDQYSVIWLDPLFQELGGLSIHESVYDELVLDSVKRYADSKKNSKLQLFLDKHLSSTEQMLYHTYINKLAPNSKYDPSKDNKDDRGEVKSLSYMAVKGFMYFASHDNLPATLVEYSEKLKTGLGDMTILHPYDVIFYLYKKGYDRKGLRILYKYLYYLSVDDKKRNPCWEEFIDAMEVTYAEMAF